MEPILKILIVDISKAVRMVLRRFLEKNKFNVIADTDNIYEALTIFKEHKPDVVIIDYQLSGSGGMILLSEIRKDNKDTIIIINSNTVTPQVVKKAMSSGANHFLIKPINRADLLDRIKSSITSESLAQINIMDSEATQTAKKNLNNFMDYIEYQEDIQDKLEKLVSEKNKLAEILSLFKKKQDNVLMTIDDLNGKLIQLNESWNSVNSSIKNIESQKKEYENDIRQCENEIVAINQKNDNDMEKLKELRGIIKEKTNTQLQYSNEIKNIEKELSQLKQNSSEENTRKIAILNSNSLRFNRKIMLFEKEKTKISEEIKEVEERINNVNSEIDRIKKLEVDITPKVTVLDAKYDKMLQTFNNLERVKNEIDKKISTLENIQAELNLKLDESSKRNNKLGITVQALTEENERIEDVLKKNYYKEITVMFSDLKDSMKYFEKYGPLLSKQYHEKYSNILQPIIKKHGRFIKSDSTKIFSCYAATFNGISAAIEMQREISKFNTHVSDPDNQIHIRIWLHFGVGIVEDTKDGIDVYGNVVNTLSRFGKDRGDQWDQIIVSKEIFEKHVSEKDILFQNYETLEAKGKKEPLVLYKLIWKN